MRAILVDDEPMALDVLKSVLLTYEDIHIVGGYTDPKLALEDMENTKPDVIFLDIEMGPVNGLSISEDFIKKNDSLEIVFITAYSQYAIDAFELNVIDYVLKPIQENRLDKTINRLRKKIKNNSETQDADELLKINCFGNLEVVNSLGKALAWRTQKSKELFTYLLVQREKQALKGVLIETIFPDKKLENANTLLHTTIYQLRKNLKTIGFKESITFLNGWYKLNIPIENDFEKLDKIISSGEHGVEEVNEILRLYKGDFLEYEGYYWAISLQEKYKRATLNILNKFTKDQMEKNLDSPLLIKALELMYKMEPYDDNIAENIICYYRKQGEIKKMKGFFQQYKDMLWKDLGLEPMDSLIKVFDEYSQ